MSQLFPKVFIASPWYLNSEYIYQSSRYSLIDDRLAM